MHVQFFQFKLIIQWVEGGMVEMPLYLPIFFCFCLFKKVASFLSSPETFCAFGRNWQWTKRDWHLPHSSQAIFITLKTHTHNKWLWQIWAMHLWGVCVYDEKLWLEIQIFHFLIYIFTIPIHGILTKRKAHAKIRHVILNRKMSAFFLEKDSPWNLIW